MRFCSIEDCNQKHMAKGYCQLHYDRIRRGTDFTKPLRIIDPDRLCIILNCNKNHKSLGYCQLHYQRLKRGSDLTKSTRDHNIECIILDCNKKYFAKGYCRKHYNKFCRRNSSWDADIYLRIAKYNVKKRDNKACRWYNCGKKDNIHVHHIFPISEYPELKYIEEYMICYCKEHHREWHEARKDNCYNFL